MRVIQALDALPQLLGVQDVGHDAFQVMLEPPAEEGIAAKLSSHPVSVMLPALAALGKAPLQPYGPRTAEALVNTGFGESGLHCCARGVAQRNADHICFTP